MKTRSFEMPELTDVANLMIDRLGETTLKPDSPVVCLNRGRKELLDTWDGNHIPIPVGYFRTEYGAALHFQRRLIVHGTRDMEVGGYQSWLAILGSDDGRVAVDHPDKCQPYTDKELQAFGEPLEGLSRDGRGDLTTVRTSIARASGRTQGVGGLRPQIDVGNQATDAAAEAAAHVFEPPAERETALAEAEAAVDRGGESGAPAPRRMRHR